MENNPVQCPSCGSTQIHAEKRGWNIWTGLIGSGKIVLTCLKCGHKFKPGGSA
jgi:DNA-directed RNA polymerase subunit RPC12/RpoP